LFHNIPPFDFAKLHKFICLCGFDLEKREKINSSDDLFAA
jgi:hypothetical protein